MSYRRERLSLSPEDCLWWMRLAMDLQPGPGGAGMSALFTHDRLRHLFSGELQARFVGLWPQQQIPMHADPPIAGTRYHIPIQTNPHAWVFHAGFWQQLELGKVYAMDPTQPHGAVNWGDAVRIHLMVDVA